MRKPDRFTERQEEEIERYVTTILSELAQAPYCMSEAGRVGLLRTHCAILFQHTCRLTGSIERAEKAEEDLLARVIEYAI